MKKEKGEITPVKAIMIYDCETESANFNYMEMIEYKDGTPVTSYPLPEEFLRELSRKYVEEFELKFNFSMLREKDSKIKIISFEYKNENTKVCFYTPPEKKLLMFTNTKEIKAGVYPIPAMIWVASLTKLHVFAVKDSFDQLTYDTMLYKAPFMNISNGNVCRGNMQWPKTMNQNLEYVAEVMTNGFFESKFTHFGSDVKVTNSNYYKLFNSLINTEVYPEDELVEFLTLKNVIHDLN